MLLENCFVITKDPQKRDFFFRIFSNAGLPRPIEFKGLDSCESSHYAIIELAKELDLPYIFVFEDDAYPCDNILKKIKELEEKLIEFQKVYNEDYDLVDVGVGFFTKKEETLLDGYFSKVINGNKSASQSYFLKKSGYDSFHSFLRQKSLFIPPNNKQYKNIKILNYTDRYNQIYFKNRILVVTNGLFTQCDITNKKGGLCLHKNGKFLNYFLDGYSNNYIIQNTKHLQIRGSHCNILFELAHTITVTPPKTPIILHSASKEMHSSEYIQNVINYFNLKELISLDIEIPNYCYKKYNYYQSEDYFKPDIIKKYLFIPQDIQSQIYSLYPNIKMSVGIHIRRGDYINTFFYRYNIPSFEWYYKIYTKYFSQYKEIFIVSDDINYVKNNFKIKNVKINFIKTDNDLFDLSIFSMCKHHICSASTFSWWGCWLDEQKDSINIFPDPYYLEKYMQIIYRNIIPNRWIKEKT